MVLAVLSNIVLFKSEIAAQLELLFVRWYTFQYTSPARPLEGRLAVQVISAFKDSDKVPFDKALPNLNIVLVKEASPVCAVLGVTPLGKSVKAYPLAGLVLVKVPSAM